MIIIRHTLKYIDHEFRCFYNNYVFWLTTDQQRSHYEDKFCFKVHILIQSHAHYCH